MDPPGSPSGEASISPEIAYRALEAHPAWVVERHRIYRDIRLASFRDAVELINRVAGVAERLGHHPNVLLHEWCFVRLELYSHISGGLSTMDVELAMAIDAEIGPGGPQGSVRSPDRDPGGRDPPAPSGVPRS